MKRNLTRYMQNATGCGVVFGIRREYGGGYYGVAFIRDVGNLDATNCISAGSCKDVDGNKVMPSVVYRR